MQLSSYHYHSLCIYVKWLKIILGSFKLSSILVYVLPWGNYNRRECQTKNYVDLCARYPWTLQLESGSGLVTPWGRGTFPLYVRYTELVLKKTRTWIATKFRNASFIILKAEKYYLHKWTVTYEIWWNRGKVSISTFRKRHQFGHWLQRERVWVFEISQLPQGPVFTNYSTAPRYNIYSNQVNSILPYLL